MFESTRRSFYSMSGAELGQQYDPCTQYESAMKIYAQKIAHFNQQMQQAQARGDTKSFNQAAQVAQDAGVKWAEQKRLLEQCRRKQRAMSPYDVQDLRYPRRSPWGFWPFRQTLTPLAPTQGRTTTASRQGVQMTPTAVIYQPPRVPFGFGPMFT